MNSEPFLAIIVLFSLAVVQIFTTIGCVLLTKFWASRFSRGGRTLIGALGGSLVISLPLIVVILVDEASGDLPVAFVAIGLLLIVCLVVSWIPAHFATKHLDRLTELDAETFS